MKYLFVLVLLFQLPGAGGPAPGFPPCAANDPCNDPKRPWMRGGIEIACTRPEHLAERQLKEIGKRIVGCGCQHKCDPLSETAEQTGNRAWDPRCSARCDPKGCTCKHPCDS